MTSDYVPTEAELAEWSISYPGPHREDRLGLAIELEKSGDPQSIAEAAAIRATLDDPKMAAISAALKAGR